MTKNWLHWLKTTINHLGPEVDEEERKQTVLNKKGYYQGNIDGDFGARTLHSQLDYQSATFGPSVDDGIVGPLIASALGISWHEV